MTNKQHESLFKRIDGVNYHRDTSAFWGTCPDCQIGIPGCKTCDGYGEVWRNDPRSFPIEKLQELRERDAYDGSLDEDGEEDYEQNGQTSIG